MRTDERIENLEKGLASARRFNRGLLAAVGLVLGVWILAGTFGPTMAAAPAGGAAVREVRANRFVVEDENGNVRATLDVGKDGPSLDLRDENGKIRAMLTVWKDRPSLDLRDENGKMRAMLDVGKDGMGLHLRDEKGKVRVALRVDKDGPALALADKNGETRAVLDVGKDGPGLALADEKGKATWGTPQSAPVAATPGTK